MNRSNLCEKVLSEKFSKIIGQLLDNFEEHAEQLTEDLVAVLDLKAHVERLDVGQVLQQVKVALE